MTAVIDALKRLGLDRGRPADRRDLADPEHEQNGTAIINYSASNSVNATTDDVAKSGPIVDAAVRRGREPRLRAEPHAVRPAPAVARRALAAAIRDAHARARRRPRRRRGQARARSQTVTEVSSSPPPVFPARGAGGQPSTPVEAGTVQTEEDVTVTYAIG